MSKRLKRGADPRAANPTKRKLYGRSLGPMVYNEHVGLKVTPKKLLEKFMTKLENIIVIF